MGSREKRFVGQEDTKRVSEREAQRFRDVGSRLICGDDIPGRWRTELELRSCKPFEELHRPITFGAKPAAAKDLPGKSIGGDIRDAKC